MANLSRRLTRLESQMAEPLRLNALFHRMSRCKPDSLEETAFLQSLTDEELMLMYRAAFESLTEEEQETYLRENKHEPSQSPCPPGSKVQAALHLRE